jgi:cytochrome d ubiquinol oxidase subunit I
VSWMTFSGWVASVAGWYVTEIGRQPWIVQGLVSTADVVAQHPSATLAGTLFGYVGLYIALMIAYMKALRIMAIKPAKTLEHDSNPLGTPLVGAAT